MSTELNYEKKEGEPEDIASYWDLRLSREEAIDFLSKCDFRYKKTHQKYSDKKLIYYKIEVLYQNQWLKLSRTDLTDDVCTSVMFSFDEAKDSVSNRKHPYVGYGARIRKGNIFAVIDQYSDG